MTHITTISITTTGIGNQHYVIYGSKQKSTQLFDDAISNQHHKVLHNILIQSEVHPNPNEKSQD